MQDIPGWLSLSFVFLAATVILVPLSRALGLGSIIGYLGAGMAIGPWGFGLVRQPQDILAFAEFGVVLMMFLVGLQMQPRRLWSLRVPLLGWGSVQVVSCAGVLTAAGWLAGADVRVAVVAGLGLALSSTAIAMQVLTERNLLATRAGQTTVAISLFQDIAALPIIALLPLLAASSGSAHTGGLSVLPAMAVVAGIVLGGHWLLRPLLRWIARSRSAELFTAASLLLVVGLSLLMLQVGLSMALGAFIGGVLLADSEYRRELETDIEPFKGLLLGLFFMAVGMGLDFGVIVEAPGLMLALVAGFLLVKAALMWPLAALSGVPPAERGVFTILLAQGSEFAFVVFQSAALIGLLDARSTSLLVGAVAVSMLVGPLLLAAMQRLGVHRQPESQPPGEISEPQDAAVILAGFGRYGQIVARLLLAEGVRCTVLDHDAEMIEVARRFDFRVHYGDASRLDLLRMAGAESARVLVIAVDDPEQSLRIAALAREHFPQLAVVARARDVTHWNQLRELGVVRIERELFESSLRSGRTTLELLGYQPYRARQQALRFRQHNLELLEKMLPHHRDRPRLIAVAREGRAELERVMAQERADRERERAGARDDGGWHR